MHIGPNRGITVEGPKHSPTLRSPLDLKLGLLYSLLLSSELNYFGSDALIDGKIVAAPL